MNDTNDTNTGRELLGTTLRHDPSGRTGTCLERNQDETLLRWNGGTGRHSEWQENEPTEDWLPNETLSSLED